LRRKRFFLFAGCQNALPNDGSQSDAPMMKGARCPECGNYAVIKKNGCDFCGACGYVGGAGKS